MMADRMTKRMIEFQKDTFEMMLDNMNKLKDQSGRAAQAWAEQMARLPQEGVTSMRQWMDVMGETRNELNAIMRDNFENWGRVLERTVQQSETAARQTQETAGQYGRGK
jgi:hypothetical protein